MRPAGSARGFPRRACLSPLLPPRPGYRLQAVPLFAGSGPDTSVTPRPLSHFPQRRFSLPSACVLPDPRRGFPFFLAPPSPPHLPPPPDLATHFHLRLFALQYGCSRAVCVLVRLAECCHAGEPLARSEGGVEERSDTRGADKSQVPSRGTINKILYQTGGLMYTTWDVVHCWSAHSVSYPGVADRGDSTETQRWESPIRAPRR